jgi:hypothetical protein
MTSTLKRWIEAIAQNTVAAILFAAGTVVVVYLLTDAGHRLTVRVWWLAIAVVVLLCWLAWLLWLTAQVRSLRARVAAIERPPAAVVAPPAPPPHPYQDLLDRMGAMIEQLKTYESHELVSWQTGQTYNDLMSEARVVEQRLKLSRLPVATELPMQSGPSITQPSARELAGALLQARIQAARVKR